MSFLDNKSFAHNGLFMPMVLKRLAIMMPILITAGIAPASEGPRFCSDVPNFPVYVLTGCDTTVNQPSGAAGAHGVDKASSGASQAVEDPLFHPSPHPLVQVGRHGLSDAPPGEKGTGQDLPATAESEGDSQQPHTNTSDAIASPITQEDRWYYTNIDQDGTHIFFGDLDSLDERMALEASDDFLPKGFGIGKRWQF